MRMPLTLLPFVVLLGGCVAAPAAQERESPRVISVTGTGRVSVTPDTALVDVGVDLREATLAGATAEASRRASEVVARVKALGVAPADIVTVAYSVDPVAAPRRGDEDAARIVGYRVVNVVRVRILDVAAAGRIVDGAVAAGANTVSALRFTMNDPAAAEAAARAQAISHAAAKAGQIAAAAGVGLGEVLSIDEEAGPRPILPRAGVMATMAGGPGPVEPGQLEVAVSVQVRYRIAPR